MFLFKIFQFDKFESWDFKYGKSCLKFYQKNTQITHFWSQIYTVLYFCKILQFDKAVGAEIKYGNNYFESLLQKYLNKAFLFGNFGIFVFSEKFGIRQIWGRCFQIWQYSWKFVPKKNTQIRHIWSKLYVLLFLFKVLEFDKSEGVDFKYENSYLKFYQKNIQTTHFCVFSVLYFCKILQFDKFDGAVFKYDNTLLKILPKNIAK